MELYEFKIDIYGRRFIPREITRWEEREYGLLFYNGENKDSYDSNHAIIFRERISDLAKVLEDIVAFYTEKGMKPSIYQSILEEGYFEEIKEELSEHGLFPDFNRR